MVEITLTADNFETEVLRSAIPVLVDFWATWCGPCMMLAPTVEELAKEYDGRVKVGKIDVDDQTALAIRYGIESIPTLLFFKNGEIVGKSIGYVQKNAIVSALDRLIG